VPPQRAGARVTTVHDLSFFAADADTHSLGGRYLAWVCQYRLHEMDAIIADSPATKRMLINFLETKLLRREWDDFISVVPLGVDEVFYEHRDAAEIDQVLQQYALPSTYLLHVGTREPRKNIAGLLHAYAAAVRRNSAVPPLVLAGQSAWRENEISALLGELKIAQQVHMPGFIAQEHMPALYRGATMLVYPSMLEGFGLPVLEAMASAVPVVCSSSVAVVELLRDGTVIDVDPTATEKLADAIVEVVGSPALRQQLSDTGLQAARRFTWNDTARRTLDVYRRCLAGTRAT
jgi:glycosyltransferase involved in cell wall biosynthesis